MDEPTEQKQELLLAFHRVGWEEMTWRRNAGYRTVILGLAYCGILLTVMAYAHPISWKVRGCVSLVVALASVFGSGYLAGNYREYMKAAGRIIRIEEYLGAFRPDFLGHLGALMPADRLEWPKVPLHKDPVSLWSVITFAAGGLGTAAAILIM
jgi:hypothetical protein